MLCTLLDKYGIVNGKGGNLHDNDYLLLRPVVRGKLLKTVDRTNADRILDQTAIVIQTIDAKQETGQIRLMGQIWSARAADPNDCIPEGETVVVTAISGVKAIVKRA